ncbi:aspartate aminotransferase family protein [Notoacmeibacter sp. MSK16QG-6]|uniref:aspartate aminotransferase family protein n=1 Tax=Notoacmeibacter sp. MSK16QG-6 TaxID=2957982 RepID=UPI0020A2251E|nr:aspartate aminotransferase family protein [Notoacmeibacter sp. MSK16QG-6]MCP1198613.1 aspartate aminotransferase family protein [Notoacmeibacter sp. MSK16QG-6]
MSGSALFDTFARAPLSFERGEGAWVWTTDGEKYLDFASGVAVNALGHANPRLQEALSEQAAKLWHVSNLYEIPIQRELAELLCANSFADRAFFCNSGAEAVEAAIKTARRYHYARDNAERIDIITFEGAFHGRTLATIAAGGQAKYLEGFGPKAAGFTQLPFDDHDAAKAAIASPTTAAVMIEPIQGEGGVRPVETAWLRELRDLCDEHGVLLIFDEVQTGIGRTGRLFAHEWAEINPDILAVAKGLGGGFPVGACLATEEAAAAMTAGTHGSTFGGNPLAMAVGKAVVETVLEDGFLDEVNRKALLLKQGLAAVVDTYPDLFETVRGAGLLIGLKCRQPAAMMLSAVRDEHLLLVPAGDNILRFLPPLNVEDDDIRRALDALDRAASALSLDAAQTNGQAT